MNDQKKEPAFFDKYMPILLASAMALLVGSIVLFLITRPMGKPITLSNRYTPAPFYFQIQGAVMKPGLYRAEGYVSYAEAAELADGFTHDADLTFAQIRLPVRSGDVIIVPTAVLTTQTLTPLAYMGLLNLNTATLEELMSLPGIGQKKALDILTFRENNQRFEQLSDLLQVSGIGIKTIELFYDKIIVE